MTTETTEERTRRVQELQININTVMTGPVFPPAVRDYIQTRWHNYVQSSRANNLAPPTRERFQIERAYFVIDELKRLEAVVRGTRPVEDAAQRAAAEALNRRRTRELGGPAQYLYTQYHGLEQRLSRVERNYLPQPNQYLGSQPQGQESTARGQQMVARPIERTGRASRTVQEITNDLWGLARRFNVPAPTNQNQDSEHLYENIREKLTGLRNTLELIARGEPLVMPDGTRITLQEAYASRNTVLDPALLLLFGRHMHSGRLDAGSAMREIDSELSFLENTHASVRWCTTFDQLGEIQRTGTITINGRPRNIDDVYRSRTLRTHLDPDVLMLIERNLDSSRRGHLDITRAIAEAEQNLLRLEKERQDLVARRMQQVAPFLGSRTQYAQTPPSSSAPEAALYRSRTQDALSVMQPLTPPPRQFELPPLPPRAPGREEYERLMTERRAAEQRRDRVAATQPQQQTQETAVLPRNVGITSRERFEGSGRPAAMQDSGRIEIPREEPQSPSSPSAPAVTSPRPATDQPEQTLSPQTPDQASIVPAPARQLTAAERRAVREAVRAEEEARRALAAATAEGSNLVANPRSLGRRSPASSRPPDISINLEDLQNVGGSPRPGGEGSTIRRRTDPGSTVGPSGSALGAFQRVETAEVGSGRVVAVTAVAENIRSSDRSPEEQRVQDYIASVRAAIVGLNPNTQMRSSEFDTLVIPRLAVLVLEVGVDRMTTEPVVTALRAAMRQAINQAGVGGITRDSAIRAALDRVEQEYRAQAQRRRE